MSGDIAVSAPGRVNLIGEHTDYTGGLAMPIAIDRHTKIRGRRSDRLRLRSADESEPIDFALHEVRSASLSTSLPQWGKYVAAVAEEMNAATGIDGEVSTTIPVGAGLSSSASLEVAVALALGFSGTASELAEMTQRAEHRATGVPTGLMDQLAVAGAVDGHAALMDCSTFELEHVPVPADLKLVVRFVVNRTLIGSGYSDRVRECEAAEAEVGPLRSATMVEVDSIVDPVVRQRARHVVSENDRVRSFADALRAGDSELVGELLTDGHRSLRDDFEVSTPVMDAAVAEAAAQPGVFGARMTGGGFGGCIVIVCDPDADVEGWVVRPVAGALNA